MTVTVGARRTGWPTCGRAELSAFVDRAGATAGGLLEAIVVAAAAWPPISPLGLGGDRLGDQFGGGAGFVPATPVDHVDSARSDVGRVKHLDRRSEEHTSELQSQSN